LPIRPFRIYADEDSARGAFVSGLRLRGVEVLTSLEAGMSGADDEDQLTFATRRGYIVYSFNASDFLRIHTARLEAGGQHAGIILAPQQRYSIGEQIRRVLCIRDSVIGSMRNRVEFLSNWG
jgi:hypothetical protein